MRFQYFLDNPESWRFCFVDDPEAPPGGGGDPDPDPAPDPDPDPAPEPDPSDWRAAITSDDARKFAESSPSIEHLAQRGLEMRQQLSSAIVPPGKDAKPEEISAYNKKIGIPETAADYTFAMPEGQEASEEDKAFHATAGELFHGLKITSEQAEGLNKFWNEAVSATNKAQVEADKAYADASEATLRKEWQGEEYDKNREFAERAVAVMYGAELDNVRKLETKDGRYLLDHPALVKAHALVGREMAEGGLVPPLSESDKTEVQSQIESIRKKISEAQGSGNTKEANRLFQEEQKLIAAASGNQGIVGGRGRVA